MLTKKVAIAFRTVLGALLIACMAGVPTQAQERGMAPAPPPIEPSNLFSIPAGRVTRSLDLDITASGLFLGEGSSLPTGTSAVLGLGDIAEVELGSMGLGTSFRGKGELQTVPTGGLKVYLPMWKYWHGVAAAFRRSGTHREIVDGVEYEKRVGNFLVVGTLANFLTPEEGNRPGAGWKGIKIKTHMGVTFIDPNMTPVVDNARAFWRPFGGFEMWRKDARARIMAELDWTADFSEAKVDDIWTMTGGVRFFFSKHVVVDIGVRYQSNYSGLAESIIHSKLRMSLPTHLIRERIIGI